MHSLPRALATVVVAAGLGLAMLTAPARAQSYRRRHAALVQRREQELRLLERHLGRLPVSEILPNTDREAAAFRPALLGRLAALPAQRFSSVEALVRGHRDPQDQFSFADYDFLHAPGGHAPMVDFRDNPWLGEALHLAWEHGVLISLICHAPIAMTSTWQRVDRQGRAYHLEENPFLAATITTVPKHGERAAESAGYVHLPGQRTRLTYYVDQALKAAGFTLRTGLNPAALKLVYEPAVGLLTGNGPQTIDAQARTLRSILSTHSALRDARLSA